MYCSKGQRSFSIVVFTSYLDLKKNKKTKKEIALFVEEAHTDY